MSRFQSKGWYLGMAIIVLLVLTFVSCDNGGGGDDTKDDPVVYESTTGGTTYKLEITKNTSKAAFIPASGDLFKMTITKAGGSPQISSGSIQSVLNSVFTLAHSSGGTFNVTVNTGGNIINITGTIPIDGGSAPVTGPGAVTPDVNMAGTTWKGSIEYPEEKFGRGVVKISYTFTFAVSTFTVGATFTGAAIQEELTNSGTYTVKGNTVTCSYFDNSAPISFVVNGNTFVLPFVEETITFTKQ